MMMNNSINFLDKNYAYEHKNKYGNVKPFFGGNLIKNIDTIQLGKKELSQVSAISNMYKQLNLLFKSTGNYMNEIFQKGLVFILGLSGTAFVLKNTLKSDDVNDVKFEQSETPDNLMNFTLLGEEDKVKLSVSKSGEMQIIADDELSDFELKKYLDEINKNHGKLFENVLTQTEEAINSAGRIINEKIDYDFDLKSPEDMQRVVKQFISQKKRVALLSGLINERKFWNTFKFEEGAPRSLEENVISSKNISYRFSQLENRYFKGMQITVTNETTGTKQGFVATSDGNFFKTDVYSVKDFVPRKVWRFRQLKPLSAKELNDADLNEMFHYAYSHNDKVYRHMLNIFYERLKNVFQIKQENIEDYFESKRQKIEKFNDTNEKKIASKSVENDSINKSGLFEDKAKIIRTYKLNAQNFKIVKELKDYNDRLSEAYLNRVPYQRPKLNEKSGFVRRKFRNGIIFKDLLENKDYMLGMAQYLYLPKSHELISFGIFDTKLNELARFKVEKNGEAKLLVKPGTPVEEALKIEQLLTDEMSQGLYEKMRTKLDTATYYHEHMTEVDSYIRKSYRPLTMPEAVKELMGSREYYAFDAENLKTLKEKFENIRTTYRNHQEPAYKWQRFYFPEVLNKNKKYMYGKLDKQKINYEFSFIDSLKSSGLRILTRDSKGNFDKGYVIEADGSAYKLITMPKDDKYSHLYVEKPNFSKMDENAVKAEHLDLIFNKILEETVKYSDFCDECIDLMMQKGRLSKDEIIDLVIKHKPILQNKILEISNEIESNTSIGTHEGQKAEKNVVTEEQSNKFTYKSTLPPTETNKSKRGRRKKEKTSVQTTLSPEQTSRSAEFIERYAGMLKPNGEFKGLETISLSEVCNQFDRIFSMPYMERSPHLIHEKLDNGRIFEGRFSVMAPDGARISVSRVKSPKYVDFLYYSIRIQKDDDITYINIDPINGKIIKSNENVPVLKHNVYIDYISKSDFIAQNTLCKNMPMYFNEIFDERLQAERKIIPFQKSTSKRVQVEKRAMLDFEQALNSNFSLNLEGEENRM